MMQTDRAATMTTVAQLSARLGVEDTIVACLKQCAEQEVVIHAVRMMEEFTISHITRTDRVAGFFSSRRKIIGLHAELFVEGREKDLKETFLHEVAHLIQRAYIIGLPVSTSWFTKPHGAGWKSIMRRLGETPNRTADYSYLVARRRATAEIRTHRYEYTCRDCGHVYKTIRPLKSLERRYHGPCKSAQNSGRFTMKKVV
jgi:predicted SprT family Zn-dependent metalloprotease